MTTAIRAPEARAAGQARRGRMGMARWHGPRCGLCGGAIRTGDIMVIDEGPDDESGDALYHQACVDRHNAAVAAGGKALEAPSHGG